MNDNPPIATSSRQPFFEGVDGKAIASLVADLTPVVGEGKAAVEAAQALYAGDYEEAALASIGIIPVIGPKAKAVAKMYKANKAATKGGKTVDQALDVRPVSLYKDADTTRMVADFNDDKIPPGLVQGMEESGFDMAEDAAGSMKELIQVLKKSPEELADADQWSRKVLYHVGRTYGIK